MIKTWRIAAFAAALAVAALVQVSQIRASRIQISHWIGGASLGVYSCQLYYPGGYAAIAFDNPACIASFARMPQVEVIAAKAPVQIARSEVAVEAQE